MSELSRTLLPWGPGRQMAVTGTGLLIQGSGCITYSGAYETTGAATATVAMYDGGNNNGQLLFYYTLTAGQSTSEEAGPHWWPFQEGLYVVTVAGSVAGTIGADVDHLCRNWLDIEHRAAELAVLETASEIAQLYGG